jgi:hypothetical protein
VQIVPPCELGVSSGKFRPFTPNPNSLRQFCQVEYNSVGVVDFAHFGLHDDEKE